MLGIDNHNLSHNLNFKVNLNNGYDFYIILFLNLIISFLDTLFAFNKTK